MPSKMKKKKKHCTTCQIWNVIVLISFENIMLHIVDPTHDKNQQIQQL
jgi:hypothetical protein